MRKILYILCFGILLTTCDDGDVIEVTLDFNDTFSQCGELVFFKINGSTSETLSIQFNNDLTVEQILDVGDDFIYEETFPLGNTNVFNYRSYSSLPVSASNVLFCNDVPPSNLNIERDEVSISGEVTIRTVLVEDDNDGIPAEIEDENLDGDNNPATNPTDTDQDGIPDYLDIDDDGDNVLTIEESVNYTAENGFDSALDTDGDGDYNYLDPDDDGDGVLTRDEESVTADLDPTNDRTISDDNPDSIPDYLNDQITTSVTATEYREHRITLTYTVSAILTNISLPSITQQTLDFGTLVDDAVSATRVEDTIFN